MQTKTLVALLLSAAAAYPALAQDRWLGADKPKHVAVSALSAVIVESMFADTLNPAQRFWLAMLPGVVKELADSRRGGSGISGKDFAANALGVGLGMAGYHVVIKPGYVGINLKF